MQIDFILVYYLLEIIRSQYAVPLMYGAQIYLVKSYFSLLQLKINSLKYNIKEKSTEKSIKCTKFTVKLFK